MSEKIDLAALKHDILRVIEAGANRDEMHRLEREIRVVFDRASAVPMLIAAKERLQHDLELRSFHRASTKGENADLIERLSNRVPYYREWAKDIREMNGQSVDADYSEATAKDLAAAAAALSALQREADGLRQSIAWVGEVYPATNPESGGAVVHMTWEQFNAMRECVGLKPVKGRRSPQAEADKGSDQ